MIDEGVLMRFQFHVANYPFMSRTFSRGLDCLQLEFFVRSLGDVARLSGEYFTDLLRFIDFQSDRTTF